jgi:hypothetical protein
MWMELYLFLGILQSVIGDDKIYDVNIKRKTKVAKPEKLISVYATYYGGFIEYGHLSWSI